MPLPQTRNFLMIADDFFAGCLGWNIFPGVLSCVLLCLMISLLDAMAIICGIFQVLGRFLGVHLFFGCS